MIPLNLKAKQIRKNKGLMHDIKNFIKPKDPCNNHNMGSALKYNWNQHVDFNRKEILPMETILIGFQALNFSTQEGKIIDGFNIYVAYHDDNVTGHKTEKFFVRKEIGLPEKVKINDHLYLGFNHKGKVISITTSTA